MPDSVSELMGRYIRPILDVVPSGVFITDASGGTLYINSMYEQLTGLKLEDLQGKNVRALVEDGVFDCALNPEIVRTGRAVTRVQKLKNGNSLVLSGFPVFDKKGVIRLVVTFARDITLLSDLQEQVESQTRLIQQMSDQLSHLRNEKPLEMPVFSSKAMEDALALLKKFAQSDATILIQGETGSGKEVFSQLAHRYSPRHDKVILKVDCGSISETLTESELFGYVGGAFTGASNQGKAGYFELANGGTIFLDEVGELPLGMQTRLLRVLQDGEIVRVGSSAPKKVDVRVVAATNRDLEDMVKNGSFRQDLFYRLNVASLRVPPLRERAEDVRPLAKYFLRQFASRYHKSMSFMNITLDLLEKYAWPGNVRELQNLIHSLVITLSGPFIAPSDLPSYIAPQTPAPRHDALLGEGRSLKEIVAEMERDFLTRALEVHGSVRKVSELFKVDRTTIFRKLKKPE